MAEEFISMSVMKLLYHGYTIKKICAKALMHLYKPAEILTGEHKEFRKKYGCTVQRFRVGIHIGIVTVGEIGVIKKDLAMSGDTMNTTARIRTCCSELNQKYLASKDFIDRADLDPSHYEILEWLN